MKTHNKALTLMVLSFGIGCIITILVSLNSRWHSDVGSHVEPRPESRVASCDRLHPVLPNRVWDEVLEVYLPPNYGWWECMGVGR